MKKALTWLLALTLLFSSCGTNMQEKETVNQASLDFCTSVTTLDFEVMLTLIEPAYIEAGTFDFALPNDPAGQQALLNAFLPFISKAEVTVVNTEITGDTAVVTVSISYINLAEHADPIKRIAQEQMALTLAGVDDISVLTVDDLWSIFVDGVLVESENEYPLTTEEIDIALVKIDDEWHISADTNMYVVHVLLSNMLV